MTSKVKVNGAIIRWARNSLNLSVDDVAHKLRQPPDRVQQWEEGTVHPTYAQLERLAYEVLKRPLAVFFFPEPPAEKGVETEFRTLPDSLFDEISAPVRKVIRKAQAWQLSLREMTSGQPITAEPIWRRVAASVGDSPTRFAETIRSHLGVSMEEQKSWREHGRALEQWRSACEQSGVAVFKAPFFDEGVSGFCLFDDATPLICINNSTAKARQIFTLVHELTHILLGVGDIEQEDRNLRAWTPPNRRLEQFCNVVTAEVLVPSDVIGPLLEAEEPTEVRIAELSELFSVSREVILRAAKERGLATEDGYDSLAKRWNEEARASRRKGTSGGDYYANQATYLSRAFGELVFSRLYRNEIDQDTAADYLQIRPSQVGTLESMLLKGAGR